MHRLMREYVRNYAGRKQRLFLPVGNKFKFGPKGARRLRYPGKPEAFADKEVEGVSVALEEAGFGPERESLILLMTNLFITAK